MRQVQCATRRLGAALVAILVVVSACAPVPRDPSAAATPLDSGSGRTPEPARTGDEPSPSALDSTASPMTDVPAALASGFRVDPYPILSLPLAERAYAETGDAPLAIDYPATAAGVPTYVRGGRTYLHPVGAAQQALRQLSTYVATGRPVYLDRARVIAEALLAAGTESDGGLWIPYEFDFNLHGSAADVMRAPWYSGMAQGQVLSLVSRLYELTGDARYLDDATRIFRTFEVVGQRTAPWVVWVEDQYLWLEEYPGSPPDHTLNGFIFALYGVYDYYVITRSDAASRLFRAGLTTIDRYLPEFRNPGGISNYCLLHHALSEKYHRIHIAQLRELTRITGDSRFADMAALFESDFR